MDFNDTPALERVTDESPQVTSTPASEPAAPSRESVMARVAEAVQGAVTPPQAAPEAPAAPAVTDAPAPAAEPEQVATDAQPPADLTPALEPEPLATSPHLSRIAELAMQPLEQSLPAAIEELRQFAAYDPQAEDLLYRSVLTANWDDIQNSVLTHLAKSVGVPQDKAKEFAAWIENGAPQLPTATTVADPPFPEPNADNIVRMWDGQEAYDLDLNDPRDRQLYDLAKRDYQNQISQRRADEAKAQTEAQQQRERQQQQALAQQQQIETRHREFNSARAASLVKAIEPALPKLEGDDAALMPILMHSIRGALEAMTYQMDEKGNPATELGRLYAQAKSYVEQGAGKTEEFARRIDTLTALEAKKIIDTFNRFILKANKAEVALTATAPQVPAQVPAITVQTPAAPQTQKPQNREEWAASIMARTNQALASLPVTPR